MIERDRITDKYYNVDELTNYRTPIPLVDSEQFIYQVDLSREIKLLCKYCLLDNSYCFYEYEVIPNKYSKTISYKIMTRMIHDLTENYSFRDIVKIILSYMYNTNSYKCFDKEEFNLLADALEKFHTKIFIIKT